MVDAPKLSVRALEALVVLLAMGATPDSIEGTTGGPFARMFWPATWKRAHTSRRHGLRMRGGMMLSDLKQRGFVSPARGDGWNTGYKLSTLGLERARAAAPTPHAKPCPGCGKYGHSVCADFAAYEPSEEGT